MCLPYEVNYLSFACLTGGQSVSERGRGCVVQGRFYLLGVSYQVSAGIAQAPFDCTTLQKSQSALNLKRRSSSTSTSFWRFFFKFLYVFFSLAFLHFPVFAFAQLAACALCCQWTRLIRAFDMCWLLLFSVSEMSSCWPWYHLISQKVKYWNVTNLLGNVFNLGMHWQWIGQSKLWEILKNHTHSPIYTLEDEYILNWNKCAWLVWFINCCVYKVFASLYTLKINRNRQSICLTGRLLSVRLSAVCLPVCLPVCPSIKMPKD